MPHEDQARLFLHQLDQQLAGINFLWRARRREAVLAPPQLLLLFSHAWEQYIAAEVQRVGTGDYQYKHPGIVLRENWIQQFQPVDIIRL